MEKELKAYKDLDVRRNPTTPDSIYFVLNSTTQKVTEIWITSSQNIPKRVELNNSVVSGNISQFVNDAGYLTIGALPKTKVQFNTSLIDGDFLFVGDVNVYTDEQAQDAVGTILVDSAEIDFTYNDATPSITASIKAGSIDETKLDLSVNNSLNLANSALQAVALTNYFNKTVDDTDDVVEGLTNKFTTITEKNKISQITVTQPVNLDTLESDVAGKENTANKVSTITTSATNFPNNNAVIAYVASNTPIIQDATTTVKGIIKLANDLGGTADLPTTPTAVHKTGDESITGTKTFTTTSASNNINSNGTTSATGLNYVGQNNSVNTFTVDKFGSVTAGANTGTPNEVVRNVDITNKFIPLTGTTVGNPVTGTIETVIDENNVFVSKINNDIVFRLYQSSGDSELYLNLKSPSNFTTESFYTPTSIIFNNSIGSTNIKNMSGDLVISSPLNSLFKGLSGGADFSPNITDLDYTQKVYVDTKLTKSGDIITGDIGNTSTGFFRIPAGTTAQRPATPLEGMRRYNTTTLRDEFFANGTWQNHARLSGDTFTGAITATSIIRTGGLATQALLANGGVLTNPISGTGTNGFLTKFTASGVLGNSAIVEADGLIYFNINTYGFGNATYVGNVTTAPATLPSHVVVKSQLDLKADIANTPIQLKDFYTDISNTGVAETDLYAYTTLVSRLNSTGEKTIASYGGTFNDATASSQLKVYFGGVVIGDTGALTMSVTGAWIVNVSIMRTGATTARSIVNISTPGASTASYTKYTELTGLTFTNTNILKITGTAGGVGGGSGDITASYGNIIWQPAAI